MTVRLMNTELIGTQASVLIDKEAELRAKYTHLRLLRAGVFAVDACRPVFSPSLSSRGVAIFP